MGYRSTVLRTATTVTATTAVLATTAACGEDPITPSVRTAIEDSCRQVYLLQGDGAGNPAAMAEAVLWGQTQSAMASSVESRAEPLQRHLAEMKRLMIGPDGRSANPSPDLAAFAAETEAAAQECHDLEGRF
jgi:hypothetical protein